MKTLADTPAHSPSRFVAVMATLLALSVLVSGCTSMQSVPRSGYSDLTTVVKAGDKVSCRLVNSPMAVEKFTVTAVEPAALMVGTRRILASDISWMEVKRIDTVKTVMLVGSVAALGALVGAASNMAFMPATAP